VTRTSPIQRQTRGSDSPFVERITRVTYDATVEDISTPDGCWDLVIRKRRGEVGVLQTGLITRPVALDYEEGDEYVSISFKLGVFMPRLPPVRMVDRAFFRPKVSKRAFWLDGDSLEIPTFENAEGLVDRLTRGDVLVRDDVVEAFVEGRPMATSPRSLQRHFLRSVGLTSKTLAQIARAQRAVELIQQRRPAVEVALELGYADQSHMTNSLKRIMGQTPTEIIRSLRP
jgi:hypothetical protein